MTLDELFNSGEMTVGDLSDRTGLHRSFLWKVRRGLRQVSPQLAIKIECETGGRVTRLDLRPDIFGAAPTEAA